MDNTKKNGKGTKEQEKRASFPSSKIAFGHRLRRGALGAVDQRFSDKSRTEKAKDSIASKGFPGSKGAHAYPPCKGGKWKGRGPQ